MEEYCFYGAWLNRYINLPACFHKDQKLRGQVGMIPFHRSKPGIVLGKKIWHFFKVWPIVFVSVFAFVIFGYAILYGVRIELQKLSIQYERLGNRTATNYSAGTWMSQYFIMRLSDSEHWKESIIIMFMFIVCVGEGGSILWPVTLCKCNLFLTMKK